ncbi:MAG: hypothetical protein KBH07_09675 [Flavobacteriales bacterium]|nr:hypothetical protein [Flavobacteriales bacterium]
MTRALQLALLLSTGAPALLAPHQASAQEAPSTWPLVFAAGTDQVQVFKPQPESFDGTSFTARAAVALQRQQDESPVFGAIWGNGVLAVDRTSRQGELTSFQVTDLRFPGITSPAEQDRLKAMLSEGIAGHAPTIDIDWLVAALEEEQQVNGAFNNTPPQIIYREQPAILLYIDGDPVFQAVKENPDRSADGVYAANTPAIERVVNTPYFLVRPKGGDLWLYGSGLWYNSKDIMGPWAHQPKAPKYLEDMAARVDTSYQPAKPEGVVPEVVASTKPAVLLDLNGAPQLQPYDNSSLMYVTNTDEDLFLHIPTQEYYLLASGRWYTTKDLRNGPWQYVAPDALPQGFSQVPEGSAKDGILAHVAGTPAAREAVRDASIPQTAKVDRRNARVTVSYDGSPQFRQIPGTNVYSAENASTTVLRINGRYHVCDNAVWYEGDTPDGPWAVSTSVPQEVNGIPPSDPAYKVRYVYIYDHTPDAVYIGYTPGYLGSYVQSGVVIYGTGYYYDPWHGSWWYPRPYTWGFNMYYNPWYGWGFGASWGYNWFYPAWNHYGYYHPYSWGWWGPYAYCPPHYGQWHDHGYYGNGHYYGHRPGMAGRTSSAGRLTELPARASRTNLYDNHRVNGITPTQVASRPTRPVGGPERVNSGRSANTRTMPPMRGDYFTDGKGNIFRTENGRTEQLGQSGWNTLDEQGRTPQGNTMQRDPQAEPQRQQPHEVQPGRNPQAVPGRTAPAERQNNPWTIQQERSRGEQRVNDFRGYQQDRRPAPVQHAPQRTAPPAPRPPAPAPPAPTAPSRGNSGGGGHSRSPR